jgi:hypothetical protein
VAEKEEIMTDGKRGDEGRWEDLEKGHQPLREDRDGVQGGYEPERSQDRGDDGPPNQDSGGKK